MPENSLQARKRKAEVLEFDNHEVVHNQAANQTIHGSQYFGNVNIYNGVPTEKPGDSIPEEVLASLAFSGMLDRKDSISRPQDGTCEWILDLDEYCNWRKMPHGLLWVKGKPGSGKSTMMSFLYQNLQAETSKKDKHLQAEQSIKDEIHLHFFFNARGEELQHTTLGMLRSLLHQLLRQCPSCGLAVVGAHREKYAVHGSDTRAWEWQQSQLERLLSDALIASALHKKVTVLIDALDEAGEQAAQRIARYIHNVNDRAAAVDKDNNDRKISLKFCISSRHYPIPSTVKGLEICMEYYNEIDIEAFLDVELSCDTWPVEDIDKIQVLKHDILAQSKGIFQWVCLIVPLLLKEYANGWLFDNMKTLLKSLPQDLEDLYGYIIQGLDRKRISQSFLLFQWVHLSHRPLRAEEMMAALDPKPLHPPLSKKLVERRIKSLSGGLIELVDADYHNFGVNFGVENAQVIHQTVKEFLEAKGLRMLYSMCEGQSLDLHLDFSSGQVALIQECHSRLYWICLTYFTSVDLEAVLLANETHRTVMQIGLERKPLDEYGVPLPLLGYAVEHMFHHAQQASAHDSKKHRRFADQQREVKLLERIRPYWAILYNSFGFGYSNGIYGRTPDLEWSLAHIAAAFGIERMIQVLIDSGHPIDLRDGKGETPFHLASLQGHLAVCEVLYKAGVSINTLTKRMRSPLYLAASQGHLALLKWLLSKGVKTQDEEAKGAPAISGAVKYGWFPATRLLVDRGADVNAQRTKHGTPLHIAVSTSNLRCSKVEMVRFLLAAGANVNARGGRYETALQAAAAQGSAELIRLLLDAGADVNARGGELDTALQAAAYFGSTETVRLLLDAGADVHAQGGEFWTPLYAAARRDEGAECVAMLLDAGADVNSRGGDCGTVLQAAAAACKGPTETIRVLLDAGADVKARGGIYDTALQAAAACGSAESVRLLLDAGADVHAQGGEFWTPLYAAARMYDGAECVAMLLDAGADVNSRGGDYGTALQAAAAQGSAESIRLLLDAGADVNARGGNCETALQAAAASYNEGTEILRILLDAGADVHIQGGQYGNALGAATRAVTYAGPGTPHKAQMLLDAGAKY